MSLAGGAVHTVSFTVNGAMLPNSVKSRISLKHLRTKNSSFNLSCDNYGKSDKRREQSATPEPRMTLLCVL